MDMIDFCQEKYGARPITKKEQFKVENLRNSQEKKIESDEKIKEVFKSNIEENNN
jgi:hypothetical protein